jgi:uncharacterized protein (TIGR02646 family)
MRPVNKGTGPLKPDGTPVIFKAYNQSRRYLIDTIGEYCSYCERKIEANLAIEHVQPKSLVPELTLRWSNFLLGCTNCNSTKGDKSVTITDFVWPDIIDTYSLFRYSSDGIVREVNTGDVLLNTRIANTIELVGLNSTPPLPGSKEWEVASDRRVEHRGTAILDSHKYCLKYEIADLPTRAVMLELIVDLVKNQGFWSIWMRTFIDFSEVQRALINSYTGTNQDYFTHV